MQSYLPVYKAQPDREWRDGRVYDIWLTLPVFFLVGIGIVMVYSASSALALQKFGSEYYFLKRQMVYTVGGGLLLICCRHVPLRIVYAGVYALLFGTVLMLLAVQIPGLGITAGGATRWLRLGVFSFQPSELARLAMIVYIAYSIEKKGDLVKTFSIGFIPHVIVLGLVAGLIMLQPDFGSAAILCVIVWAMLYMGGVRLRYLASSILLMLPAAYMLLVNSPYRLRRLVAFSNPWQYATDEGYQAIHSLMAFGTGGIWGVGVGGGYQKLFYLPEPHTDFIFSVIGEELGLVGVLTVIACYGIIIWRGIRIARSATGTFATLLAAGLTFAFGLQVCINMGVALALLPTKGLTLPLLSYGGSSLLVNMAGIGLLMNIGAAERHG
jgi:cell division protein FtsW